MQYAYTCTTFIVVVKTLAVFLLLSLREAAGFGVKLRQEDSREAHGLSTKQGARSISIRIRAEF